MDTIISFRLGKSYETLYWSLFGITRKDDITIRHGQYFTELMGMFMFMAYHGMAIIVLINMLIAMMSSSFQNIEVHFRLYTDTSEGKVT